MRDSLRDGKAIVFSLRDRNILTGFVNCEIERFKCERETLRLLILTAEFEQRTSWFLFSYLDAPFSLLASFCDLAGTGNSTLKLLYDILKQACCFMALK